MGKFSTIIPLGCELVEEYDRELREAREKRVAERTLSEQDMVDILEDIAANGNNAAARIAAIKVLREMDAGDAGADDGFAALDELAPRRGSRVKSA